MEVTSTNASVEASMEVVQPAVEVTSMEVPQLPLKLPRKSTPMEAFVEVIII